jgi:hypothetical protein
MCILVCGAQGGLREDTLERNPGPATRAPGAAAPRYPGDELDYDVAEWHDDWKASAAAAAARARAN